MSDQGVWLHGVGLQVDCGKWGGVTFQNGINTLTLG